MQHFVRHTAWCVVGLGAASLALSGCGGHKPDAMSHAMGSVTSAIHPGQTPGDPGAAQNPARHTEIRTPAGEFKVAGNIYQKYRALGAESSPLGVPRGPQHESPGGGQAQDFQGGTIYDSGAAGTHVVWGDIKQAWERNGGAGGALGYPVSDEQNAPGGKKSDFHGGTITWNQADRQTTIARR